LYFSSILDYFGLFWNIFDLTLPHARFIGMVMIDDDGEEIVCEELFFGEKTS